MKKTLKILFASSCNNRPSLALKHTQTHTDTDTHRHTHTQTQTHTHTHTPPTVWLIQAGQLVDFHHLMQAVIASLLSCCLSNCQLCPRPFFPSNNISGSQQSPCLVLLLLHTPNALCFRLFECLSRNQASWKFWYATHTFHVLLGSFARWIFDRDLLPAGML